MKKQILCMLSVLALAACTDSEWIGDGNVFFEPQELALSKSSLDDLIVGETRRLYAAFTPAETTRNEVLWSSDDESVATVDADGAVHAVGLGEAVITVQSVHYPEIQAACAVSVTGTSGIRVYDLLLDAPVEETISFVRNSTGTRDYWFEVFVHDTFDKSVTFESSNEAIVQVEAKEVNGTTGFALIPGQEIGDAVVTIRSTRNDDVWTEIPINVKTVHVRDVALSLNADRSEAGKSLSTQLTISREQVVQVVFTTDEEDAWIPENGNIAVESSNPAVATVDAAGTQDPATQLVSFKIYMVDDPGNVPDGTATITVRTEDGGYEATVTVAAKCPGVEQLVLSQTLSDPIHAGESLQLTCTTIPEDAYVQSVKWSSADPSVAEVDPATGLVTIKPDFTFDAEHPEKTEILITATSDDESGVTASCKLRPYQYVEATGVMVTDQWGNRMRGTGSTTSKVDNDVANQACITYCAGNGTNKTSLFNDLQSWAVASPAVEGVDKVGSIAVYLTATPYPYEYPKIADPEQPFYWACYSNSRFSVAGAGYEDGSQAQGWSGYSNDNGKATLFLGHTCKFWTGHKASGNDALFVRVWRYDKGGDNSSSKSKSQLLFRCTVNTSVNTGNGNYAPSLKNDDGTAKVFEYYNLSGIPTKFEDPCPFPWTGPLPQPGVYYTLQDDGSPDAPQTWGAIPVPTSVNDKELIP